MSTTLPQISKSETVITTPTGINALQPIAKQALDALTTISVISDNLNLKATTDSDALVHNRPELTPPHTTTKALSLDHLLVKLMKIMGAESEIDLLNNLKTYSEIKKSNQNYHNELNQTVNNALLLAETAISDSELVQQKCIEAKKQHDNLQKQLQTLTQQLQTASQDKIDDYQQTIDQTQKKLQKIEQQFARLKERAKETLSTSTEKTQAFENVLNQAQQGHIYTTEQEKELFKKSVNNLARITQLIAELSLLIGENNEANIKNEMSLFETLQASRHKELQRKDEEYQAEVRKAEQLNRTLGCIGKILGAVLTVVGIVVSVATLGTGSGVGVALAAIGLAAMLADTIVKVVTGHSFIEKAMQTVMEKVIQPMMQWVSSWISELLKNLGVESKTAEMISMIIGAIAVAIAVSVAAVAAVKLSASVASKLAAKLSQYISNFINRILPKLLTEISKQTKHLLKQGVQQMSKFLKLDTAAALTKLQTGMQVVTVANTGVNGANQIAQGWFGVKTAELSAEIIKSHAVLEQIQNTLRESAQRFSDLYSMLQYLMQLMLNVGEKHAETGKFMAKRLRA